MSDFWDRHNHSEITPCVKGLCPGYAPPQQEGTTPMSTEPPTLPDLTPLDMASNLARSALAYSVAAEQDEFAAYSGRYGEKQAASARLAGDLALVSIAQDLHRIANTTTPQASTPTLDYPAEQAAALIRQYQHTDGAHHKQWVLSEVHRLLTGQHLEDPGVTP